jgi:lactose/L-arabinose transport system ATP-binding protein
MLEHLGGETFAYGRSETGEAIIVATRQGRGLTSGEKLNVGFDPRHLLLFDEPGLRIR